MHAAAVMVCGVRAPPAPPWVEEGVSALQLLGQRRWRRAREEERTRGTPHTITTSHTHARCGCWDTALPGVRVTRPQRDPLMVPLPLLPPTRDEGRTTR